MSCHSPCVAGDQHRGTIERQHRLVDFLRRRCTEWQRKVGASVYGLFWDWHVQHFAPPRQAGLRPTQAAIEAVGARLLSPRGRARVLIPCGYISLGAVSIVSWLAFLVAQVQRAAVASASLLAGMLYSCCRALYLRDFST